MKNEIWYMNSEQWMLLFQGIVALGAIGWIVEWGMSRWKNRQSQRFRNLESDITRAIAAVDSAQKVLSQTKDASEIRPFFQNDILPVFSKLKELDIRPKVEEPLWFADDNLERNMIMVAQWLFILKNIEKFSREGNLKKARKYKAPEVGTQEKVSS